MTNAAERALDTQVRLAAFRFLEEKTQLHGETLTSAILRRGFEFRGEFVKLVGPQGIFKPKILTDYPLSLTTVAPKLGQQRPYDDGFQEDGTVVYRYRGTNPSHPDNMRLRAAMQDRVPLIYFHATVPARYIAAWPVYVIGDEPKRLAFHVDVDDRAQRSELPDRVGEPDLQRRYALRTTRDRLHQQTFRDRVLKAYREHCAVCRLRHTELLDAAHIIPDADPEGEPRVSNGLSLCKLHHAAYDQQLIGIRPDFTIHVRSSILEEHDGPMLHHGLQLIHDTRIYIPRRPDWRPSEDGLGRRYEQFLEPP